MENHFFKNKKNSDEISQRCAMSAHHLGNLRAAVAN